MFRVLLAITLLVGKLCSTFTMYELSCMGCIPSHSQILSNAYSPMVSIAGHRLYRLHGLPVGSAAHDHDGREIQGNVHLAGLHEAKLIWRPRRLYYVTTHRCKMIIMFPTLLMSSLGRSVLALPWELQRHDWRQGLRYDCVCVYVCKCVCMHVSMYVRVCAYVPLFSYVHEIINARIRLFILAICL